MAKPKVAIQGGGPNYLGKQPTVSGVPKKWKSSPDHPTAELAYITKKEKDILIDLDLYGSLKGKPNKGPGGIPSLQGDMGSATRGGFNAPSGPSGPRGRGEGPDRRLRGERLRQQMYPGIFQGERIPEYRQRMEQQRRQAAIDAERKAREEAARQAQEEAARRAQQEQQRLAEEAAARQAAEAEAARQAQEEAARQAAEQARQQAEQARQQAEQERLAAIEEQRRLDAQAAGQQRQAQALGTFVTTGPGTLNRPADPLPRYRGYTPMDFDVSRTGSLTDQYARMLNVPFFQPFIEQEDINLAPGATTADSIFGIESLMPTYTYDPNTGLASNPYGLRQGGRVHKDMGGFIGFMDEPLNIMHPRGKIDVVDNGISSILKKYKEIRSEL
jgi:hypothetical protein